MVDKEADKAWGLKGGRFPGCYLSFCVRTPLAKGFKFPERLQVEFAEFVMGDHLSLRLYCVVDLIAHTHPQVLSEPLPHMPVAISGNKVLVEVTML